jgi:hypothetical protein
VVVPLLTTERNAETPFMPLGWHKEAIWLRGLLSELDIPAWKVKLFCDKTGCIANLKRIQSTPNIPSILPLPSIMLERMW